MSVKEQRIVEEAAERWSEIILGDLGGAFVDGVGLVDDLAIEVARMFICSSSSLVFVWTG
jgi:hypothetical protein